METRRLDYEAIGEEYERANTSTGGGGGGGGNKEKHQGRKTQEALKKALIEARKRNTTLFELKNPEQTEDVNTDINKTLERVFGIDEDVVGIPSLSKYVQWVYQRLNTEVKPPVEQECKLTFETSSGPGGQNVNKVSTAVRIVHLLAGFRFEQEGERSQDRNRSDADDRMEKLVDEHLDKWSEYVVGEEGEMRKIMVKKIREVFAGKMPKDKEEYFDGFCKMMGRYPRDHRF